MQIKVIKWSYWFVNVTLVSLVTEQWESKQTKKQHIEVIYYGLDKIKQTVGDVTAH